MLVVTLAAREMEIEPAWAKSYQDPISTSGGWLR
jgi:hypothetical protein